MHTVTVPDGLYQLGHWLGHNWGTALGVLLVAIVASLVVETLKRSKYTTNDKEKLRKVATYLLVFFSTLFSYLSYVIFFVQSNLSAVQQLPVVGSHAVQALGVATVLYNLRLNNWYKRLAVWLKQEARPTKDIVLQPSTVVTPVAATPVATQPDVSLE